ncbi:STAS domain-containing protein [Streptomyces collinus]|uniref:STAS domain-containing protein n=1 Tax=Streptomyces collinus TaxID=42684 RepID=UPI003F4DA51F
MATPPDLGAAMCGACTRSSSLARIGRTRLGRSAPATGPSGHRGRVRPGFRTSYVPKARVTGADRPWRTPGPPGSARSMPDIPGTSAPLPEHTARVVTLHGELDLLTAPALRVRLDDVTAGPCPDLVLDLRPVSFIDCGAGGPVPGTEPRPGAARPAAPDHRQYPSRARPAAHRSGRGRRSASRHARGADASPAETAGEAMV